MKIVLFNDLTREEFQSIQAQATGVQLVNVQTEEQALQEIEEAEAFYGNLTPEMFSHARKLEWVQAPVAGLEHFVFPALAESDVILTNMAGIYSDVISDHALAYLLMFARGFHLYRFNQMEHLWQKGAQVRHLASSTLGVVGLGGIGAEVARKGKALGLEVWGIEARDIETPEGVDMLLGPDDLDLVLAKSDFLVLCVPHTPDTVGLISKRELALMPNSAYLINIGRGVLLSLEALVEALETDEIAGAGLDVFEKEPLPPEHPLWQMRNVIITPHSAATSSHIRERHIGVLTENIDRFRHNSPLHNVVGKASWYLAN